jgi:hypothetical protein
MLKQMMRARRLESLRPRQVGARGSCGIKRRQSRRSQDIEGEPRVATMLRQLLEGRPSVDKVTLNSFTPRLPSPASFSRPEYRHEWGQILPRDNWRLVPIPLDAHPHSR